MRARSRSSFPRRGVLRSSPARTPARGCPPRRRTGAPPATYGRALIDVSSPPTRGCTAIEAAHDERRSVLPTDAGVLRRRPRQTSSASRPPRRRGGDPAPLKGSIGMQPVLPADAEVRPRTVQRWPTSGSPRERGCSGDWRWHCSKRLALPAGTGVLRCSTIRPSSSARPPRWRGGVPVALFTSSDSSCSRVWEAPRSTVG